MAVATLGLGSNLGDRLGCLQQAVDLLHERGMRVVASSRVWETAHVGGPQEQPPYLNAVVLVEVGTADAPAILATANAVEQMLGRTREVHWGPRTIDIDILLFDGAAYADPNLTIPHPRMTERAFVLLPLLDVLPDPVLPDGTRVLDLPLPRGEARPVAPPLRLP